MRLFYDDRLPTRFWAKVAPKPDGCWVWTAAHVADGYGNYKLDGRAQRAHRVAYQALVGEIPEGMTLDHLCRRRDCVNPGHMEVVSRRENTIRGEGATARNSRKTHCAHGHEFTEANTYLYRGWRVCRKCNSSKNYDLAGLSNLP